MDNVVHLNPPAPPAPPAKPKRRLKHSHFVERALLDHNDRILEAIAVLKLIDEASAVPKSELTWESWDAINSGVAAARRLLRGIGDLTDAEALAKLGTDLYARV